MSETSNNTQTQSSQPAPKGWVRWSGLGVFAGIVVAVVAIGYFSFTTILKSQLEHYASQAWGRKSKSAVWIWALCRLRSGCVNCK